MVALQPKILRIDMAGQKIWLAAVFTLIVLAQGWFHMGATGAGRPYENWDEVIAYNNAQPAGVQTFLRSNFPYGPLDTAMQWAANVGHGYLDPIGNSYPHIRYSNNAPSSWGDPLVVLRNQAWNGLDYSVFRGIDDRYPIFLSRQIHLGGFYAILWALGLSAIAIFGVEAIYVLVTLLLLSVSSEMYFQATQSLPNAINGLLAFGVALFAMIYCARRHPRDFLICVFLFAIGTNFKTDLIVTAVAPIMALGVLISEGKWKVAFRLASWGIVLAVAAILITRPALWVDPVMDLRARYHQLLQVWEFQALNKDVSSSIFPSWPALRANLNASFLWQGASGMFVPALCLLSVLIAVVIGIYKKISPAKAIAIGAITSVLVLAVVLRTPGAADRHFINGLAIYFAMIGIALVYLARINTRWRMVASAGAAVLALVWGGHSASWAKDSLALVKAYEEYQGLDPAHHRNLASLAAMKLAKARGVPILIDQHAYIDLRIFRSAGVDAQYINMDNIEAQLARADRSGGYVVIFSRGDYNAKLTYWSKSHWPEEVARKYDSYQLRLLSLPRVQRYEGRPQPVLSGAPIGPADEILVAFVRR